MSTSTTWRIIEHSSLYLCHSTMKKTRLCNIICLSLLCPKNCDECMSRLILPPNSNSRIPPKFYTKDTSIFCLPSFHRKMNTDSCHCWQASSECRGCPSRLEIESGTSTNRLESTPICFLERHHSTKVPTEIIVVTEMGMSHTLQKSESLVLKLVYILHSEGQFLHGTKMKSKFHHQLAAY